MASKNRELKEAKVLEIKERMEKAQSMVISKYQGLTVEEDTELRRKLREEGVEYKVYKNTLSIIAAKELGFENLVDLFQGPVSIALGYDDPTAPARILYDFAKEHKKLELKGGMIQGEVCNTDKIKEFATIPPKEVLLAKLVGSFKAPLSNLVYLLNAIKAKKESEEA
ncbi:50S ribosomal protein L10 [Clostridium acetireducens DSM 10703]|jgi:large subunit ribosomal protein L10|uniref:Large ribosomal subunit protein uL10 n=1 Tax=Clostridium acetireducens DSM 10703 TaxID=1121290 RepID=A0A1E8F0H9_9CLOT|nr:50S ribosomal protein L10 [Clostridium acetireducens]OFI06903.1 50S ribosomal protein L10 [Clostridium acetireducens DSM 10703]